MLLVDFINVGYGDAILLRETETPFAMLVDCGDARIGRSRPDGRRITAADYLRREGIRELDLLVLTHLHLDHAGGLTHLLPGVRVREFWTNYLPPEEMWGHTLPAVPGAPAGARCLMTSMGIYVKALAHLRSQKTEIRLIRTPCDCRRLTETLSAGVFLEDEELRLRQASIWSTIRAELDSMESSSEESNSVGNHTPEKIRHPLSPSFLSSLSFSWKNPQTEHLQLHLSHSYRQAPQTYLPSVQAPDRLLFSVRCLSFLQIKRIFHLPWYVALPVFLPEPL